MPAQILELIDKVDSYEQIRDQIAAILVLECAKQKQLATADGQDPKLWDFRVFTERSDPWSLFQGTPGTDEEPDADARIPVVNVWFESEVFQRGRSSTVDRQLATATFSIDCLAHGQAADDGGAGQILGDEAAARLRDRTARLVRNILMSGQYAYLGLRGQVASRWVRSITPPDPETASALAALRVSCSRIAFEVTFNEFAPQVQGIPLDLVTITMKRPGGQIILQNNYQF